MWYCLSSVMRMSSICSLMSQRLHRPHLRPDHLGVTGRGHLKIEVLAPAESAE